MPETKKLSIRLAPEFAQKLEELAKDQGISLNSALQRAIATEFFVKSEIRQGSKIVIEKPDRTFKEVVFQ